MSFRGIDCSYSSHRRFTKKTGLTDMPLSLIAKARTGMHNFDIYTSKMPSIGIVRCFMYIAHFVSPT